MTDEISRGVSNGSASPPGRISAEEATSPSAKLDETASEEILNEPAFLLQGLKLHAVLLGLIMAMFLVGLVSFEDEGVLKP